MLKLVEKTQRDVSRSERGGEMALDCNTGLAVEQIVCTEVQNKIKKKETGSSRRGVVVCEAA